MKKMRKAKVITALALTVVMLVAMTGIAVADQLNIYDPGTTNGVASIQLAPGGDFKQFDLNVSAFLNDVGTTHSLSTTIYPGVGGQASDIIVEYQESGRVAPEPAPYSWTQDAGVDGAETLDLFIKASASAPEGVQYSVVIADLAIGESYVFSAATVSGTTSVPEFTTIAMPVAAILGLLFFFNHRKRKKE